MLTLEERGAYNTILDLIYSNVGNGLIDDDHYLSGWMRCDLRVWKRIKLRLIALNKIYIMDGKLRNLRADYVIDEAIARGVHASQAGRISASKRASQNNENNDIAPTTVVTDVQPSKNKKENKKEERKKEIEGTRPPQPSFNLLPIPAGLKPDAFFLPDWIDAHDWADFAEMRKKLKKPMTERAAKAVIKKLENYRSQGHDVSTILEQSIRNSWQDVYEPKVDYQSGGRARSNEKPSNWDKTQNAVKLALDSLAADDKAELDAGGECAAIGWEGGDFGRELSGQPQITSRPDETLPTGLSSFDAQGKNGNDNDGER